MHPKIVIGKMGFEKGAIAIPFSKQLTLSDYKMIQKMYSMALYDIRGQLYECTIYETNYI